MSLKRKLPAFNFDYSRLNDIISAPIKGQLLQTAIELKVFNYLINPVRAEDIAQKLNIHSKNTELFLDALAACKILIKDNGKYRNGMEAQAFLVEDGELYLGEWLSSMDTSIEQLPSLIKNGPPSKIDEEDMNSEEMCIEGTHYHALWQLSGYANKVAERCAELPGFYHFKRMLDLGGGPGLITAAVLSLNSEMEGVIFDRKSITDMAIEYLSEYEMSERVSFLNDDYIADSIGEKYDLIIASDTFYYSQDKVDILIKKIFNALGPGGIFFGIHATISNDGTSPEPLVVGMLSESLSNTGTLPTRRFLHKPMNDCGFSHIEYDELHEPSGGIMEITIGHKGEK